MRRVGQSTYQNGAARNVGRPPLCEEDCYQIFRQAEGMRETQTERKGESESEGGQEGIAEKLDGLLLT